MAAGLSAATPAEDLQKGIDLYTAYRFEQAESVLRGASSAEPDNPRILYYLGLTLLHLDKNAEAQEVLLKADQAGPASADIKLGLAWAYTNQGDFPKAEAALAEAKQINADSPDLPYYRGLLELAQKQYQAAANDFETAIKGAPNNAYAHYYAGMAYSRLNRPDRMLAHFQQFVKMAPDAPEAGKVRSVLQTLR